MKRRFKDILASGIVLCGFSNLGNAQPPDSVQSDNNGNTAMGDGALASLSTSNGAVSNTAAGAAALHLSQNDSNNTAVGTAALYFNDGGSDNTALGDSALVANRTGSYETAVGSNSMRYFTGQGNTATGYGAMRGTDAADSGDYNTALGFSALLNISTGNRNTSTGANSLLQNTSGIGNSAFGVGALQNNTTASDNVALGYGALYANSTGSSNAAVGVNALYNATTGGENVAIGYQTLYDNITGSNNIAIGNKAGTAIAQSNNIDIGNSGLSGDEGIIRIGTSGANHGAFLQGVYGKSVSGSPVYVSSTGQLGVVVSSERFKTQVSLMTGSDMVLQLRPVSFHLKSDPNGPLQYGLIAEEVAKVYPDLVIRDDQGRIDGVRYDELAPLLLSELQSQHASMAAQALAFGEQRGRVASLENLAEQQDALIKKMQYQLAEVEGLRSELRAALIAVDQATIARR